MRCTQPMGLAPVAVEFLKQNAVVFNGCEHCGRNDGYERKVIGQTGMFDEMDLHEYPLKDGRVAREFVQGEIWSSGPMIWTALEVGHWDQQGNRYGTIEQFLWPESEICDDSGEWKAYTAEGISEAEEQDRSDLSAKIYDICNAFLMGDEESARNAFFRDGRIDLDGFTEIVYKNNWLSKTQVERLFEPD